MGRTRGRQRVTCAAGVALLGAVQELAERAVTVLGEPVLFGSLQGVADARNPKQAASHNRSVNLVQIPHGVSTQQLAEAVKACEGASAAPKGPLQHLASVLVGWRSEAEAALAVSTKGHSKGISTTF